MSPLRVLLLMGGLLAGGLLAAQEPVLGGMLREYQNTRNKVMVAARKTPEKLLDYQPTKEVFPLRKMYLHIAGAAYNICASFQGKPGSGPKVDVEKKAAKAEVLETLEKAFAYCDAAAASTPDAALGQMVMSSNRELSKSYHFSHLIGHTNLHYGNVVTYLRLNGIAPGGE